MKREEYLQAQEQLLTIERMVDALDLDAFISRSDNAASNAISNVMVDPVLCRLTIDRMAHVRRVAVAAREFRYVVGRAVDATP